MRYMSASIRVGPSPARALSTASETAWNMANTSVPSTLIPGSPSPQALSAELATAICRSLGTEMAYWLFWTTKTTGSR